MPRKPAPTIWTVYKFAARLVWLGTVEAVDESEAVAKAVEEFGVPATRLLARPGWA